MNLFNAIRMFNASDGLGPGSIGVSTPQMGVTSPDMKRRHGLTQVAADSSASDLAQHHTWQEPSSTDTTIMKWNAKRALEKNMGRSVDPFEGDAEIFMLLKKLRSYQ
jgi:hypothetical protein